MNQLLGILMPAVFTTYFYEKVRKKEMNLKVWIIKYLIFVLFTNILNYAIVIFCFKKENFIFTNLFTLKYLILGVVLGVILSVMVCFIEKNFDICVRTENNEK